MNDGIVTDARSDYEQLISVSGLLNAADPAYWAEVLRLARKESRGTQPMRTVNIGDTGTEVLCRYCWRPIFERGPLMADPGRWDLTRKEYENTLACDARGDGAVLSTLPHEPAPYNTVAIGKLIELAAQSISMPGTFRDTDETYDLGIVRLITEAAGLTIHDEDYVYAAIIRAAYQTRGKEFQRAAYRYQAMEPWGRYWHAHRPTRRNSS